MLRVQEGIFNTSICRGSIKNFDKYQIKETKILIERIIYLQDEYKLLN